MYWFSISLLLKFTWIDVSDSKLEPLGDRRSHCGAGDRGARHGRISVLALPPGFMDCGTHLPWRILGDVTRLTIKTSS